MAKALSHSISTQDFKNGQEDQTHEGRYCSGVDDVCDTDFDTYYCFYHIFEYQIDYSFYVKILSCIILVFPHVSQNQNFFLYQLYCEVILLKFPCHGIIVSTADMIRKR